MANMFSKKDHMEFQKEHMEQFMDFGRDNEAEGHIEKQSVGHADKEV